MTGSTVLLITRRGMGHGEPDLQIRLLRTYLNLLIEDGQLPEAIALYTEGVHLALADSPVLDLLQNLQARGVHLILCKTCLDHYGVAAAVRVGIVGGMGDIVAAQYRAARVISL
jgi:sulfur relay (sulfurtransferase) complex TusBCD TusD component (DsrE family)